MTAADESVPHKQWSWLTQKGSKLVKNGVKVVNFVLNSIKLVRLQHDRMLLGFKVPFAFLNTNHISREFYFRQIDTRPALNFHRI